jgi:hypothetical protein
MAKEIKLYYFLKIRNDRFYEILNGKQKLIQVVLIGV